MSDKKKRKLSEASPGKIKESRYEDIIKFEETESKNRTSTNDMELFHKTCMKLKELFGEMLFLKKQSSDPENCKNSIILKQREGAMHFILLKKLNRLEKYRIKDGRNALQKEKLRVDTNQLHLQNLLYEASHLKREIHHCYLFKSQDEDIDLISEEEFYANALATISRPNKTKTDNHGKRLARLEWELHQRKELSLHCKELTELKRNVTKEISLKIDRLNSLVPCLKSLLKATKPLQLALGMNIENEWEMQKSIKLLPLPLYLAFVNISAYAEACDQELSIVIEGEADETRPEDDHNIQLDKYVDSDNEESEMSNRKVSRYSKEESREINRRSLLKPHSLYIKFTLINRSNVINTLSVSLRYFPKLRLITAVAAVKTEETGVTAGDVVSHNTILCDLYDADFGVSSPNPRTKYQLAQLSLNQKDCLNHLIESGFGKPYQWCQKVCGIEFIESQLSSSANSSPNIIKNSLPDVIKRLKLRLFARLILFKQILALENKNIDLLQMDKTFSRVKIVCSLVQWTSLTWEDYSRHPATRVFVSKECVCKYNVFYRAVITRGSAKLECLISIPSDFPKQNPIWSLCVSWNGVHIAENNPDIKDMEYWINSLEAVNGKKHRFILCSQLCRTLTSFDIYLETESPSYCPAEFTQDKTFFKSFSQRCLSRPYQLIDNGNTIIFKEFI